MTRQTRTVRESNFHSRRDIYVLRYLIQLMTASSVSFLVGCGQECREFDTPVERETYRNRPIVEDAWCDNFILVYDESGSPYERIGFWSYRWMILNFIIKGEDAAFNVTRATISLEGSEDYPQVNDMWIISPEPISVYSSAIFIYERGVTEYVPVPDVFEYGREYDFFIIVSDMEGVESSPFFFSCAVPFAEQ